MVLFQVVVFLKNPFCLLKLDSLEEVRQVLEGFVIE